MAKTIQKPKIEKKHRLRLPILLSTCAVLAASSISDGNAFAARHSPLADSGYSWTTTVPAKAKIAKKAVKHKPAAAKKHAAKAKTAVHLCKGRANFAKCQAIKAKAAIAPADVLSVHAEKAKAHQTASKAHATKAKAAAKKKIIRMHWYNIGLELVGAATLGFALTKAALWLAYRVPLAIAFSRRKYGGAKARLREKFARIRMRFRENIALRRARRAVMSLAPSKGKKPYGKPRLTIEAITATALDRARTMRSKKAQEAFLLAVEKELSAAFGPYDLRMRGFYAGMMRRSV
jgi:hypothetical protein